MELTEAAIDALEAGRELDALVAEHLFSFVWLDPAKDGLNRMRFLANPDRARIWLEMGAMAVSDMTLGRYGDWDTYVPKFSTTWEGAGLVWEVIEMPVKRLEKWDDSSEYSAAFGVEMDYDGAVLGGGYARADTPMLAICRAALKVKLLG